MTPGSRSDSGELAGRLRVVRVLKGKAPSIQYLSFPIGWCGGLHLDVGHYYVVATSQTGRTLQLWPGDLSVLDLGGTVSPLLTPRSRDQHRILAKIDVVLKTGKAPSGFPSEEEVSRTTVVSPAPPRPAR